MAADRGGNLVEYSILLGLIAVVCIAAVSFLGETTGGSLSQADLRSSLSN